MHKLLQRSTFASSLVLFFAGWGVLAILLAWSGIFYGWIFILYAALFIFYTLQKNGEWGIENGEKIPTKNSKKISATHSPLPTFSHPLSLVASRLSLAASPSSPVACRKSLVTRFHLSLLILLAVSFFLASFLQPTTFFSGRDEGSIFQASYFLTQHHSLYSPSPESQAFFTVYGEGKALNFPGFYYTRNGDLITQFPVASIAWYASFLSLFGLGGLVIANGTLLFLFAIAMTLILESFTASKWTLLGTLLFFTSFPLFWFSRFTLSENFFLAFFWLFIWTTYHLSQKPTKIKLFLFFLLAILLLFGRIEGVAFLGMALLFLLWKKETRTFFLKDRTFRILLPLTIFTALGVVSLLINTPFYITIAKGFLHGSSEAVRNTPTFLTSLTNQFQILFLYGIPVLVGCASIAFFLVKSYQQKSKKISENILILSLWITLPSLLYIFISFISPDHPWMLRRFMFSVAPLLLLFSFALCALFYSLRQKIVAYILITLLFLSHLGALFYFFPLSSGKDLLASTRQIAQAVPENELLLVDQLASGDGFHMLAGPLQTLFNRHAVYFMNPTDIEKIDTQNFSSVSLLVPENRIDVYETMLAKQKVQRVKTFPITFATLENTPATTLAFPEKITLTQTVVLFRWKAD